MEIKKEEPKDYAEIYEVVKRAFNSAECAAVSYTHLTLPTNSLV